MTRNTDIRRDSKPKSHVLYENYEQKAKLEARNGLLQFDEVIRIISEVERGNNFKLSPSTIRLFHKIAIKDIYSCAGNYRTTQVLINGTDHQPPLCDDVPTYIKEMCDLVNNMWNTSSPVHLASYVMWRINWIHPFSGGNGRTSRAVSYLILCAKLRYRLPGTNTIPDQIVTNRQPYYFALDGADSANSKGVIDVSLMENLLSTLLAKQLTSIHDEAVHLKNDVKKA